MTPTMLHSVRRAKTARAFGMACAVLLATVIGCGKPSGEARVTRRDITARVPVEGEVVAPASAKADIYAPYDAQVANVYVTVGQSVSRGDAVIDFAQPQTQTYYDQARASLLQARHALDQARAQFRQQVKAAEQQLAAARTAQKQAAAKASAEGGAGPSEEPQGATATIVPDVPSAQQAVVDARARMAEELVPYQQALASARQQFQQAQAGVKAAQVKSPISGTVLAVNISSGQTPAPRQKAPLVTVVNLNALQVRAGVPERDLTRLRLGDPATITFREVPNQTFLGYLDQIYSKDAGFLKGQDYAALVNFRNLNGRAKPGMDAEVSIQVARARDVLAVPVEAVYEARKGQAVKVRRAGRWRTRYIQTGISDGDYIEVRSGLQEGDVVQTNPPERTTGLPES